MHPEDTIIVPIGSSSSESLDASGGSTVPGIQGLPIIPGYTIEAAIGRGSMGMVYRAKQHSVGRVVALKMMRSDCATGNDWLVRFQREVAVIGSLSDPRVVQIYESGQCDHGYFFSMEYLPGGSLESQLQLAKNPLSFKEAVTLMQVLASAVSHAHERGVIHRDLKPGNILFDARGEPKVVDFGLAKIANSDQSATHAGGVLGTPHYMSPEQAEGKGNIAGPQADVYSLGAILYRLITHSLPFDGGSIMGTLDLVLRCEPRSPRSIRPSISRDLETICLRCLEKDPAKRYASARLLVEDLGRFLEGRPILARPVSKAEQCYRWTKRNPAIASLSALAMACCCLVAVLFGVRLYEANQERIREAARTIEAGKEASKREEVERRSKEIAYTSAIAQASGEVREDPSAAQRTLGTIPNELQSRWEVRYLLQKCNPETLIYTDHKGPVWGVAYSPDGHLVASVGSGKNTLCVWNAENGATLHQWTGSQTGDARSVTCIPGANQVATGSGDGIVRVFSLQSGMLVRTHSPIVRQPLTCIVASPDGRCIAAGSMNGLVTLWECVTGDLLGEFIHGVPVTALAFTPDSATVLSGGGDTIKVWNRETGDIARAIVHSGGVRSIAVHPDGKRMFSAGANHIVQASHIETGEKLFSCAGHTQKILSVCVSHNGSQVVSGGEDKTVRGWNADTGEALFILRGHESVVSCVAAHPHAMQVATAGAHDKTARLWDVSVQREYTVLSGHTGTVTCVAAHPAWSFIATGGGDQTVRIFSYDKNEEVRNLSGHTATVNSIVFTSDGTHVISGSDDANVKIWEVGSGKCVGTFENGSPVRSVAVHPDGKQIVSGGDDGAMRVWNPGSATATMVLQGPKDVRVWAICHTSDGTIISGANDGAVRGWVAKTGTQAFTLYGHKGPVRTLSISGSHLFSGATDGVIVWNMETRLRVRDFHLDSPAVVSLVCASGDRMFTAGPRGVDLWDSHQGKQVLTISQMDSTGSLALCKEGHLVFVGKDANVRIVRIQ